MKISLTVTTEALVMMESATAMMDILVHSALQLLLSFTHRGPVLIVVIWSAYSLQSEKKRIK